MKLKLGYQLIIIIGVILFLTFTITTYIDIIYVSKKRMDVSYNYANLITKTILASIEEVMVNGRQKELEKTLQNIAKLKHLSSIEIFDKNEIDKYSSTKVGKWGSKKNEQFFSFVEPIINNKICYKCHGKKDKILGLLRVTIPLKSTKKEIADELKRHVLIAFYGFIVMCIAVIILMKRKVDMPLEYLSKTIEDISKGNLNARVYVKGSRELEAVTKEFNSMVGQLKKAKEEIERHHQQQIIHADRLASLGELSASLAHEIKNPLASIKSTLQVLEENSKDTMHREILKKVNEQVVRLTRTIQNLLSYSKLPDLKMDKADIHEIIEKAFFFVQKHIGDYKIIVKKDYDKNLPKLFLDREYILQVLVNMFLNSIQAMTEGGILSVKTLLDGSFSTILIADTGQGISEGDIHKIFHPFFTTKSKGTGLGLSISKRIIEMHRGIIKVESEKGKGTCFTIKLPL